MNILLIDNNKLPIELRLVEKIVTDECAITPCQLEYTSAHEVNFDEYISQKLSEHLSQTNFDVICLPFSVSENYTEYTGLRVAAHIRLSHDWNHAGTPIVFLGIDNISNVLHFSNLGTMLLTKNVFVRKSQNVKELALACKDIFSKDIAFTYEDEKYFIDTIRIEAPSNFGGHHSMANQWGADVLNRIVTGMSTGNQQIQKARHSLYFKYIFSLTHKAEKKQYLPSGNNATKQEVKINTIDASGKKILLIDDEADKGWSDVLNHLLKGAIFKTICEQTPNYEGLSNGARHEIENGNYDLIFLDLRLDGVSEENLLNPQEFSGMKILKEIKNQNRGTQVIMFTASNKAWNMKALLDEDADGYYIKESPEFAYSSEYSRNNSLSLVSDIKRCLNRSYLRELYSAIDNLKKSLAFDNNTNLKISKKLDISYYLISNAIKRDQFAFSYISLFETIETLIKCFICIDGRSRFYYFLDDDSEVENWIDKTTRIASDKDNAQLGKFSVAQQIWSIYQQKGNGIDYSFAIEISDLNDKRNSFIHNLKKEGTSKNGKKFNHNDIYSSEGYLKLFKALRRLIVELGDIYQKI